MKLIKQQQRVFEAFKSFIDSNESAMVISGPGGSGKSFLTATMIKHVQSLGLKTCIICPTNKALDVSRRYTEMKI